MALFLTRTLILVVFVVVSHEEVVIVGPGMQYENCGPPFTLTLSPNPPKIRQDLNITLEMVAAHDIIAGVVEAYFNVWPYYYKDAYCADGKSLAPKGCYLSKGEKGAIFKTIWLDDNFKETKYEGNITVRNQNAELMMCVRFKVQF